MCHVYFLRRLYDIGVYMYNFLNLQVEGNHPSELKTTTISAQFLTTLQGKHVTIADDQDHAMSSTLESYFDAVHLQ